MLISCHSKNPIVSQRSPEYQGPESKRFCNLHDEDANHEWAVPQCYTLSMNQGDTFQGGAPAISISAKNIHVDLARNTGPVGEGKHGLFEKEERRSRVQTQKTLAFPLKRSEFTGGGEPSQYSPGRPKMAGTSDVQVDKYVRSTPENINKRSYDIADEAARGKYKVERAAIREGFIKKPTEPPT